MTRAARTACSIALVAVLGGPALVGPRRCEAGPAVDPQTEVARRWFEQANRAYDKAKFDEALSLYEKAFDAKPFPAFLFNMGQCEKYLGHWQKAEFLYTRYLSSLDAKAKDRKLVQGLIDEMREKQRAQQPAPPPAVRPDGGAPPPPPVPSERPSEAAAPPDGGIPAVAPPAPPTPIYKQWWLWTAVGAVVAGGTAAILLSTPSTSYPTGSLPPIDVR